MKFLYIKIRAFVCFIVLLFSLQSSQAIGFSITPMFLDMKPLGSQARSTLTVTNSSPRAMPVQANVSELIMSNNGQIRTTQNNNDFVIFPPRAIIKPHGKQIFRVQWRGAPNLASGKTYEIVVSQILAKDEREKQQVKGASMQLQIAMAFGSIVNMSAAYGQPRPSVKSSRLSFDKSGKPRLEANITNQSNQNFLMIQSDATVTLFGHNNAMLWSSTFTPDALMKVVGLGMVQPNKSRLIKIPLNKLPINLAKQVKSAKLRLKPSGR